MPENYLNPLVQKRLAEIKKQLENIPDTVINDEDAETIITAINNGKLNEIRAGIESIKTVGLDFITSTRVEIINACWNDCLNAILTNAKITIMNLMITNQADARFLLRLNRILADIEARRIAEAWSKTGWTLYNAGTKPGEVYGNPNIDDAEKVRNRAQMESVFEILKTLVTKQAGNDKASRPSSAQAQWINGFGLDPEIWYVRKWTAAQAELQNQITGENKTIRIYE